MSMDLSLGGQLRALLLAMALGALLGVVYDLLRPLRRRTGPVAGALLDLLYCALAGCGCFVYAMGAGNGRLGLWELCAALLAFLLYMHSLSPFLLRMFTQALDLGIAGAEKCEKTLGEIAVSAKKRFPNMRE